MTLDRHMGPLRRWRGLTWVGWMNFLLLRWLFVRLWYVVEDEGTISRYGASFPIWPFPWSSPRRVGGGMFFIPGARKVEHAIRPRRVP